MEPIIPLIPMIGSIANVAKMLIRVQLTGKIGTLTSQSLSESLSQDHGSIGLGFFSSISLIISTTFVHSDILCRSPCVFCSLCNSWCFAALCLSAFLNSFLSVVMVLSLFEISLWSEFTYITQAKLKPYISVRGSLVEP